MNAGVLVPGALAGLCLVFFALYGLARHIDNYGIVDIAWSYAFGALAACYAMLGGGWAPRRILIAGMAVIWSARLGTHLYVRVMGHHPVEDGRYRQLRKEWAANFSTKMTWFFQMQAGSVVLLALPFLLACLNRQPRFHPLEIAGAALWLVAIAGESLADAQLVAFKKRNAGTKDRVCDEGLWQYSRHPNYFFEWLVWVAYFVFASGSPWGWTALISPACILYLLLRVTGIPMTEEQSVRSKGDAYRRYQETTSAFIPWFPVLDSLLEKNLLPDWLIRIGIRRLLRQRIRDESARYDPDAYVADLKSRPIAEDTRAANEQHYEVPTAFYKLCLGRRLKYSGCLYLTGTETLDQAEEAMLALYIERARIADGQEILELGCGWGSLSLYLAERFPRASITGVSNSRTQKEFIDSAARERGLSNLRIVTCDMNVFDTEAGRFDRVVSIEMFEHMKNYRRLLSAIARWLRPGGLLFVHIFTHRDFAYHFVSSGPGDWMSRHFFTGGQMPSHDLLSRFQDDLVLVADWKVKGTHYQRTAGQWLENMDRNKAAIIPLFETTYGPREARKWWAYWRIFYLSCAELWGFDGGNEWLVSHYLFRKP